MTAHLFRFFPMLENQELRVPASSVAEALRALDAIAPGFSDYLLDERGSLRRHVNVSVNGTLVVDRQKLSDHLGDNDTLYIFQALSGG